MLEDEIIDHYDDIMEPYFSSMEHTYSQQVIDLLYTDLYDTLSEEQQKKLVKLVNALSNDYARTAMASFVAGVRNEGKLLMLKPNE